MSKARSKLSRAWSILLCSLLIASTSLAGADVGQLIQRLMRGEDFRVRIQAALELGRLKDARGRVPLEKALDDSHASVRVAAAAALEKIADQRSVEALKEHRLDPSPAVRNQVRSALASLEADARKHTAKVLIKLGAMRMERETSSSSVIRALTEASRDRLSELPDVRVLEEAEDVEQAAALGKLPVVLVTGRVQKLGVSRSGSDVTYSAQIEYVLHRMPEQAIMGKVSGSASATATAQEVRDSRRRAELRQAVLDAAVASAVRRTPAALARL